MTLRDLSAWEISIAFRSARGLRSDIEEGQRLDHALDERASEFAAKTQQQKDAAEDYVRQAFAEAYAVSAMEYAKDWELDREVEAFEARIAQAGVSRNAPRPPIDYSRISVTEGDPQSDARLKGILRGHPGYVFDVTLEEPGKPLLAEARLYLDGRLVAAYHGEWTPQSGALGDREALGALLDAFPQHAIAVERVPRAEADRRVAEWKARMETLAGPEREAERERDD